MIDNDRESGETPLPENLPDRKRRDYDRDGVSATIRSDLKQRKENPATAPKDSQEVVSVRDVSLAFDEPVLEKISFRVNKGETIVIVGESGTGKSTILKLLLRLLVPDSGKVYIEGEEITELSFDEALEVRQKMGMVFQGAALFDSMTVFENVAYPLREHTDLSEEDIEKRVKEKLEFVDLEADKVVDQLPADLSGGMKKRVGIARGMANNAKIMLYDEPTSGLDPLTTATITHLILKLQRELGVTSVVVSHDIRSSFKMATKIALLHENKIPFFGTPEEMSGSDDEYVKKFLGGY